MSVINPQTGMPFSRPQPKSKIDEGRLVEILTAQDMKIQYLNQQNMNLGLYLEFIVDNLHKMVGDDGEPLFNLPIEDFPAFAEARFAEIQAELAQHKEEVANQTADEIMTEIKQAKDNLGINLDE